MCSFKVTLHKNPFLSSSPRPLVSWGGVGHPPNRRLEHVYLG